ncbi:hypothetical protein W823_14685 [Williamsia sp. D3]|nr:hypothetical protein W823_14685 [Williamsia sp. D3]
MTPGAGIDIALGKRYRFPVTNNKGLQLATRIIERNLHLATSPI